jgi:hypothetical protein
VTNVRQKLLNPFTEVCLAIVVTAIIALALTDTVPIGSWVETLKTQRFEGYYWQISEGAAWNKLNPQGVSGIDDLMAIEGPLVCLYGDSFLEGFNVADDNKAAQLLTNILRKTRSDVTAVSFGRQGSTGADHYFLIRRVEELRLKSVVHIVTFTDIEDFQPGFHPKNTGYARFRDTPELGFDPPQPPSTNAKIRFRTFLYKNLKQNWIFYSRENAKYIVRNLRFRPGPVPPPPAEDAGMTRGKKEEAFRYYLASLDDATEDPVVIAYIPPLPYLTGNMAILTEDRSDIDLFAELCEEKGFSFVDLTGSFVKAFFETGRLPHGFQNSVMGKGHINRLGHERLAAALANHLNRELADAF